MRFNLGFFLREAAKNMRLNALMSVTAVTRSSSAGRPSAGGGRRITSAVITGTRLPNPARGRFSHTR